MFKWLGICILLIAGLLAGCDSHDTPPTLRIALVSGEEGNAVKQLYPDYKDAKIEMVELAYGNLREQLVSTLSVEKSGFDVVMIDDPWFPQLAANLREFENVPKALTDDIIEKSLALGRQPYATGAIKALPFVGNTQLLFYRADLLAAAGFVGAPQTWTDVVKVARKLSSGHSQFGYAIRGRSGPPIVTDFLPIYWSLGGKLTENLDGKLVSRLDREKFVAALKIYGQLQQASPPGANNFDWVEMTTALTRGVSAMELNWPAAIPQIEAALPPTSTGSRWEVSLPPGSDLPGTSMIGNWLLAIPKTSKKSDQAERFILWLMDQQDQVANAGRPPTRKSVYNKMALIKPYFQTIREALEKSTARDRTERWPSIEDAVSRVVSEYISKQTGEVQLIDELDRELRRITDEKVMR